MTQARAVIQRIIVGRITFTLRCNEVSDEIDGYDFEAITRFDNLFTGIAVERPKNFDPRNRAGLDDIRPEDTFEAEYSGFWNARTTAEPAKGRKFQSRCHFTKWVRWRPQRDRVCLR